MLTIFSLPTFRRSASSMLFGNSFFQEVVGIWYPWHASSKSLMPSSTPPCSLVRTKDTPSKNDSWCISEVRSGLKSYSWNLWDSSEPGRSGILLIRTLTLRTDVTNWPRKATSPSLSILTSASHPRASYWWRRGLRSSPPLTAIICVSNHSLAASLVSGSAKMMDWICVWYGLKSPSVSPA